MRVIKPTENIPVDKLPIIDEKMTEVLSRKEVLSGMKYTKIIMASSRKDIMEPYVPEDTLSVVDEDLPEPTNESDGEADVTADEKLTPEDQAYVDNIDKNQIRLDLYSRYTNRVPLDLEALEINNCRVLGQLPRGTIVEPIADPGEPEEVEQAWTHGVLNNVRSMAEDWTITSTTEPNSTNSSGEAEPNSSTSTGDASTGTDSGATIDDINTQIAIYNSMQVEGGSPCPNDSDLERPSSSRKQNTENIGSLHNYETFIVDDTDGFILTEINNVSCHDGTCDCYPTCIVPDCVKSFFKDYRGPEFAFISIDTSANSTIYYPPINKKIKNKYDPSKGMPEYAYIILNRDCDTQTKYYPPKTWMRTGWKKGRNFNSRVKHCPFRVAR